MPRKNIDIRKLDTAASRLRSLAHPVRIAIIMMLKAKGKMNVTAIYKQLNIHQASASHHLNILKSSNILEATRDGKSTYYSLRIASYNALLECIKKCNE